MTGKTKGKRSSKRPQATGVEPSEAQIPKRQSCPDDNLTGTKAIPSRPWKWYRWWSIVWGIAGPFITLISLAYGFRPAVDMANLPPTDPSFPFSAPFEIINQSTFPIHDVKVSCQLEIMPNSAEAILGASSNPGEPFKTILPRETATVACAQGQKLGSAFVPFEGRIYFHIRFHYWWLPFSFTRHYGFLAFNARSQHGWVKEPLDNRKFRDEPEMLDRSR